MGQDRHGIGVGFFGDQLLGPPLASQDPLVVSSQDQKLLTQWPHLHRYLMADGAALRDFNSFCSKLRVQSGANQSLVEESSRLKEENERLRDQLRSIRAQQDETRRAVDKTKSFLFSLGELLEKQTGLSPEDLTEEWSCTSVAPIYIPPLKLRALLESYWDWIADELEKRVVGDPAVARKNQKKDEMDRLRSSLYLNTLKDGAKTF